MVIAILLPPHVLIAAPRAAEGTSQSLNCSQRGYLSAEGLLAAAAPLGFFTVHAVHQTPCPIPCSIGCVMTAVLFAHYLNMLCCWPVLLYPYSPPLFRRPRRRRRSFPGNDGPRTHICCRCCGQGHGECLQRSGDQPLGLVLGSILWLVVLDPHGNGNVYCMPSRLPWSAWG